MVTPRATTSPRSYTAILSALHSGGGEDTRLGGTASCGIVVRDKRSVVKNMSVVRVMNSVASGRFTLSHCRRSDSAWLDVTHLLLLHSGLDFLSSVHPRSQLDCFRAMLQRFVIPA